MHTINVVALFKVRPECLTDYLALLTEMAEQTHANDEGCLLYSLQQSTQDPNTVLFLEKWASPEALDAHGAKPHIADGAQQRAAMLSEPAQIIRMRSIGAGDPTLGIF